MCWTAHFHVLFPDSRKVEKKGLRKSHTNVIRQEPDWAVAIIAHVSKTIANPGIV